jgi:hypothetical protein
MGQRHARPHTAIPQEWIQALKRIRIGLITLRERVTPSSFVLFPDHRVVIGRKQDELSLQTDGRAKNRNAAYHRCVASLHNSSLKEQVWEAAIRDAGQYRRFPPDIRPLS